MIQIEQIYDLHIRPNGNNAESHKTPTNYSFIVASSGKCVALPFEYSSALLSVGAQRPAQLLCFAKSANFERGDDNNTFA